MAITSMWLGIGGLVLIALFGLGGLLSLCAVILGHVSSVRIKRNGEQGGAFATTGLVLGYVGCVISAIVVIVIFGIVAYFTATVRENSNVTY